MRKMKESGIEWIGEIPESWNTVRVKHLATEKDTLFLDGDWINSDVIVDEGIRYLTSGNVGEGFYKEQGEGYILEETFKKLNCLKVYPGDLMISRLNEPVGRCCIVPEGEDYYVVAVDNVILRPNEDISKKFMMYCMNTSGYARAALMAASGTTMQRISRTSLGNMTVPVTDYDEQVRITNYLDQKCAEIDAIIAAKEKTNELLKERRQSIIYEAVTKGLDPTVPMKDSGIEWIGEIPESWDVGKLGYFIQVFNGDRSSNYPSGNDLQEEGIPFLTSSNLEKDELTLDECKYITQEKYDSMGGFKMQINDIIYCLRGSVGKCSINLTEEQGTVASSLMGIRCTKIAPKFLLYILKSSVVDTQNALFINGTCAANLSAENVLEYRIPILDTQTQVDIVDYLDKKCAEIDALISANESTIEKLKEYRQSVIYEAVTGKVEI